MANERKKEAWQANRNVIRLVGENGLQNGSFTATEDGRRQNWMASINNGRIPTEDKIGLQVGWCAIPASPWLTQQHSATFFWEIPNERVAGQYLSQCIPDCLKTSAIMGAWFPSQNVYKTVCWAASARTHCGRAQNSSLALLSQIWGRGAQDKKGTHTHREGKR